jgi:N-6 DNA Methylase
MREDIPLRAQLYSWLGWPHRDQILTPAGAGPRLLAEAAEQKIGRPLRRRADVRSLSVGVLVPNPNSDTSETPLAVVCEFGRQVSDAVLREVHRLTWSFSKAPLLITVEPTLLRAWSCYQRPSKDDNQWQRVEIEDLQISIDGSAIERAALRALHWTGLLSGYLFQQYRDRFNENERADQTLLENLVSIREELQKLGLSVDTCHDLLARIIFIQFLFHRQDSEGQPALNEDLLQGLHNEKLLSSRYRDLEAILGNYDDAYRFFRWINDRFNGDLFPGKGVTHDEREKEWQEEMSEVEEAHLKLLAQFVSGSLRMRSGQYSLWPLYRFDAIPLEFISSIYEEFVKEEFSSPGVHYTPGHLVDFILDGVLPWNDDRWDVRILDPACGSGIFLVKAFQRLIHRWRIAHNTEPSPSDLSSLLTQNLFGVDLKPQAVRVASFSLYLAMCDAIDPRRYWQDVRFPRLRDRCLIAVDFFREDVSGIATEVDASTYDVIVGNAPWGKDTKPSKEAIMWAARYRWPIVNKEIGTLFLAKSAMLAKRDGRIAMLQSANSLLFNRNPPAVAFRQQFFSQFKIEEIVNFSALRFGLFSHSVSPAVSVTFLPLPADNEPITYICLKPVTTNEDSFGIIIEPHDISEIYPVDAMEDTVWSVKMWGGNRDQELIRRLRSKKTLDKLEREEIVKIRKGIVWGDRARTIDLKNRAYLLLDRPNLSSSTFPYLSVNELLAIESLHIDKDDSPDLTPFQSPQLLIKKGWTVLKKRFLALLHITDPRGVVCTQSYLSVHASSEARTWLESALLGINSRMAVYYLMLTSGRFASYRPEPLVGDFKAIPLPDPQPTILDGVKTISDVDRKIFEALNLSEIDRILIDDLFDYILLDFRSPSNSPARQWVKQSVLNAYCEMFLNVLDAGFGSDKSVSATIYSADVGERLPVQLIAIHLDWPGRQRITLQHFGEMELLGELNHIYEQLLRPQPRKGRGVLYHRVLRWYDVADIDGHQIPTVFLVKPNELRYWLRSVALQDADKVVADILLWSLSNSSSAVPATNCDS